MRFSTHTGVRKIIPAKKDLDEAYRLFVRSQRFKQVVDEALADRIEAAIAVPKDLEARVKAYLKEHPATAWDHAVRSVQRADETEQGPGKASIRGRKATPAKKPTTRKVAAMPTRKPNTKGAKPSKGRA